MQETYYQEKLYPLQNKVLSIIQASGAEFYLTGGTALSRFYLQHRYSEDLDFFLNAHPEFKSHDLFHKIDHWQNILSNKICALSRIEPKDMADILFIAKHYSFSWEDILKEAAQKDVWVEPLSVCQFIDNFPIKSFNQINWAVEWDFGLLHRELINVRDDIFYGKLNSLCS